MHIFFQYHPIRFFKGEMYEMMKIPKRSLFIFTLMAILLLCFSATAGELETVTNTSDSGAGSLRQAIADVDTGGTISFDNALSGDVITLSSEITINKSLTIQGLGADKLSVSGNNSNRIFYIRNNSTVNISNLAIVNGNTTSTSRKYGGGINLFAGCNLNLQNVNFENCVAGSNGGAIFGGNATKINIKNCAFKSNTAKIDGGAIKVSAPDVISVTKPRAIFSIEDSLFYGNNSINVGGAIYIEAGVDAEIDNCTFTDNQFNATGDGG